MSKQKLTNFILGIELLLLLLPLSGKASSDNELRLINDHGTFYLIKNNQKLGVTNPGILYSYGFDFTDAQAAQDSDASLTVGPNLFPGNGALVKSSTNPTVWLISNEQKHGFASAQIFLDLGFKFSSVLTVTAPELEQLNQGEMITNSSAPHLDGLDINDNGTIYWISGGKKYPYPSLYVYNTWHIDSDFSKVVPANNADIALLTSNAISARLINTSSNQITGTPIQTVAPTQATAATSTLITIPNSIPIATSSPTIIPTTTPPAVEPVIPAAQTRKFNMGITFWPPNTDPTEILDNATFIKNNQDLNVYQQLGGVPWVEASNNTLSQSVQTDWANFKSNFNANRKTYIALNFLNVERNGPALYAGTSTSGEALPAPWNSYQLDDPAFMQAYLNYCKLAVTYFNPDYLAIGIEINSYALAKPADWQRAANLYANTYTGLKALYPNLIIMPTIAYEQFLGIGDTAQAQAQKDAVNKLLPYSDAIGLSTYPYFTSSYSIPTTYYDRALEFNKPLAFTETAMPTQTFTLFGKTFNYTQDDQVSFFNYLFNFANTHKSYFVVLFTGTDYDKLIPSLPAGLQDAAGAWVYTGLRSSNGNLKKGYTIWSQNLQMPYGP